MQELASLASKQHTKKAGKQKSMHCQQSLQTTFTNTFAAPKQTNHQSNKKKNPGGLQNNFGSSKAKGKSFSTKKVKQTAPIETKKQIVSARRGSAGPGSSGRKQKQKKRADSMKSKRQKVNRSQINQVRSFFPLTQEEKELQQYKSYLLADDGQQIQAEQLEEASFRETGDLPQDSGFVAKVPIRYHKFYEDSQGMSSRDGLSRRDWQALQAMKLKNEQLTNYIEQLQKIQEKILKQESSKRKALENKFQYEKAQMLKQITYLREEQLRLNETNVTLQQLFNEGKQNLDLVTRRYNELAQTHRGPGKDGATSSTDGVQRRIIELEHQIKTAKSNMQCLAREKQESDSKLRVCQSEKEQIKSKAEEMLELLKVIRSSQGQ